MVESRHLCLQAISQPVSHFLSSFLSLSQAAFVCMSEGKMLISYRRLRQLDRQHTVLGMIERTKKERGGVHRGISQVRKGS